MSRLLEFLLGSLLITAFTAAAMFFIALQHILRLAGIADCVWQGSAQTWMDLNGDGALSRGEPPLSDVVIHVNDVGNELWNVSWPAVTGRDGGVSLTASVPGCTDTVFEVYADIPEGYQVTTQSRLEVRPALWGQTGQRPTYFFGFRPIR